MLFSSLGQKHSPFPLIHLVYFSDVVYFKGGLQFIDAPFILTEGNFQRHSKTLAKWVLTLLS